MSLNSWLGVRTVTRSGASADRSPINWKTLQFTLINIGIQVLAAVISIQAIKSTELFFRRRAVTASRREKRASEDDGIKARLARLQLNEHECLIAENLVDPSALTTSFEDIGGLEDSKNEIMDLVILPLKRPELFESTSGLVSAPKGVLFYGSPGTGKTMLAKAIAKESGCAFLNLTMASLMNKYFGESNKLVCAVFSLARKLSPAIIFIDELDCFLGQRGGSADDGVSDRMKAEFMAQWDGLLSDTVHVESASGESSGRPSSGGVVMVIGATNRPFDLDEAILRRLPRSFEIGLPSEDQRANILSLLLRHEQITEDPASEASEASEASAGPTREAEEAG
eukprot:CAMPEP_0172604930 /NCGR_PEP_ID=MMETSP1068-20121228/25185_1 /TAXON_ID=35684 /ORGANISM="Pseudopedinella elastica, Strain CCMP716" /LENGTH=339 /DNA_ID=CAMNT_0013407171 /DNA_START=110 /DNA_END=1125 /DNA_ORIENTATION=+